MKINKRESEQGTRIILIGLGLALAILGMILIAIGLLWEMPDKELFSVLTSGAVFGWIGIFLLLVVKWVQNEDK